MPVIWVDVDDETAVRVLLADNRTNDVASYDNAVLAEILTELANGPGLEGTGYDGDDLDQLLNDLGSYDVQEVEPPALADGDRAPFRQATFTLHDEQWEVVEAALAKAKKAGGGESAVNENSNGNALAFICAEFANGVG